MPKNLIKKLTNNFIEIEKNQTIKTNITPLDFTIDYELIFTDEEFKILNDLKDSLDCKKKIKKIKKIKNTVNKKKHLCPNRNCKKEFTNGHALGGHRKYCNKYHLIKLKDGFKCKKL